MRLTCGDPHQLPIFDSGSAQAAHDQWPTTRGSRLHPCSQSPGTSTTSWTTMRRSEAKNFRTSTVVLITSATPRRGAAITPTELETEHASLPRLSDAEKLEFDLSKQQHWAVVEVDGQPQFLPTRNALPPGRRSLNEYWVGSGTRNDVLVTGPGVRESLTHCKESD